MKTFIGLLFFTLALTSAAAQRICGTESYNQKISPLNPFAKKMPDDAEIQISSFAKAQSGSPSKDTSANEIINIPVVIHILHNLPDQSISDAQVQSQLTVLNNDYSNLNADRVNTPAVFATVAADTKIRFCLAQVNPQGRRTDGIIRKFTPKEFFSPEDGMKNTAQGGDDAWDSKRYLNIWVCNMGGRTLGYSSLPGAAASLDGVVISYDVFGTGDKVRAPFNKGRTATHEVGHWLGLKHIWGDAVCGTDFVDDTPVQQYYNYGCPSFPYVSNCSPNANGDMFMNFMDLTDDACMNLFTNGQKQRMRALFAKGNLHNSFLTSFACDSTLAQGGPLPPADTIPAIPVKQAAGIKLYPNPAHSTVTIACSNTPGSGIKIVTIFNVFGNKVYSGQLSGEKAVVNTANFSKGIYMVQLQEGVKRLTAKLVKE
jgi:hypothetical protein